MKIKLLLYTLIFALNISLKAQTPNKNIPYDYQFYQKLNTKVYNTQSRLHSSIKGFYSDDSNIAKAYDSLMNLGVDTLSKHSWLHRKLFQEHLVDIKATDYQIYADLVGDVFLGKDFEGNRSLWQNSRGFQVGGSVGNKFSFYLNGYENQGRFASYLNNFIVANKVVPGQGFGKLSTDVQDWAYITSLLSYTPNKYLNFALGYDKNFIGDGYRSMLLSDVSSNYSFFRLRASLGNFQYQTIYAYMLDPGAPKLTNDRRLGDRAKWMAAHYIDWNITNRLSFGFFQAVTWADAEVEGKRGFDFNYIHPFMFIRPIESTNTTSPDKMRLGVNGKYEVLKNTAVYGQFMFDEFTAKEFFKKNGYWANKWAIQIGVRGSNLLKVNKLNYLFEFNTARPYTYSHFDRLSNYANYNQSLAHPMGANFRETLGILNYSYKRFDFQGQLQYAAYGLDVAGTNFGKDIFKNYNTRSVNYGSHVGQGLFTELYLMQGKVAYLLNPKYNLRLELSGLVRQEKNSIWNDKTAMFIFGLKTSFKNLYYDF